MSERDSLAPPTADEGNQDFLSAIALKEKALRSRRRRFRNRVALIFSIALIAIYTVDLGWDRRSISLSTDASSNARSTNLLRSATDLRIAVFNEQGIKTLSISSESAQFGRRNELPLPESIGAILETADSVNEDALSNSAEEEPFAEIPESNAELAVKQQFSPLGSSGAQGNNYVLLKPIHITSHEDHTIVSTLNANNAVLDGVNEALLLEGNVLGHNLREQSSVITSQLSMHTNTRQIEGAEDVLLTFGNSKTRATGIHGTLVDGRWKLLSDVKTTLQPSGSKTQ